MNLIKLTPTICGHFIAQDNDSSRPVYYLIGYDRIQEYVYSWQHALQILGYAVAEQMGSSWETGFALRHTLRRLAEEDVKVRYQALLSAGY